MSYCRHNGVDSEVYLYHDINYGITCMGCLLLGDAAGDAMFHSQLDALKHLKLHREAGHMVPGRAFTRLRKEWKDDAPKRAESKAATKVMFARLHKQHENRMKASKTKWDKLETKIKESTLAHNSKQMLLERLKEARILPLEDSEL